MHRALIEHPNVICTPSLAAIATKRKRLSNDLADSIIALSNSTGPLGSVSFLTFGKRLSKAVFMVCFDHKAVFRN